MKLSHSVTGRLLKWVLWLVALHSIGFGLSLIVLPIPVIEYFGFQLVEKFFAVQGGVFHIVVSLAYIMAALDLDRSAKLIILSCTAKFMATIFLLSYYIFESHIFMVAFSGVADFLMGLAILWLYLHYVNTKPVVNEN
ncbi:MAG TPA: hypothetical protein VMC08_01680 [Bacteroidales bacterium]|nr:hypothetical protein [Bacteroidales bacterium]